MRTIALKSCRGLVSFNTFPDDIKAVIVTTEMHQCTVATINMNIVIQSMTALVLALNPCLLWKGRSKVSYTRDWE